MRWALPSGDASGKRFTDSIGTILGPDPTLDPDDDARHDSRQPSAHAVEGTAHSGDMNTDGTAVADAGDVLVLETRRGRVEIPWSAIHLAKPVPPPPPRRAPRASTE